MQHNNLMDNNMATINEDNFWSTNLEDIESTFLPKNSKITDLPTTLEESVPAQGSVLLHKVVNIDHIIKKPNFIKRMFAR